MAVNERTELTHYQLSPRIQIVTGDIIRVSKGTFYTRQDGSELTLTKYRGEWKVKGIFENEDGEVELDIESYSSAMIVDTATIRITGEECTSSIMRQITRRPYKVRLSRPRFKRKRRTKES